jgi:hypothetical protein
VVATVLYFLYPRLHTVPGHRDLAPATGGHAAGAPRHATAQPPPTAQPRGGGYPPAGGMPGAGGYGRHEGMEDR